MHLHLPYLLAIAIPSFLLKYLIPIAIASVAGLLAAWLHVTWSNGTGWYARQGHVLQAAIGLVLMTLLTMAGNVIPGLSDVAALCQDPGGVLSDACLTAIGNLFTKENISLLLGALVTLFGHVSEAQAKLARNQQAMANKQGVTLPHPAA